MTAAADLARRSDSVRVALRAHIQQAGKQCIDGRMWYPVSLPDVLRQLRRSGRVGNMDRAGLDACLALLTEWGDYTQCDADRGMVRYI